MDYSKLSDFEINKLIAKHEGVRGFHCENVGGGSPLRFTNWKELDYCNNPADAWPVITANGISLLKCTVGSGYWSAEIITDIDEVTDKIFQCQSSFDYQDANPLRAAMIVFLMMQDSANVQDNTA
ncbi:phage protein NinX family protein [Citrobacter freundii]|uniref:phage protein NinX family protein n=1 Tax=Citrobacter freundii TaxID=546 RepID=UPI0028E14F26|nr:phage protein NinX family protein [Citrobacter freundii]MDT9381180.1 phage protein NinX family protein [Citrobacter freundii]